LIKVGHPQIINVLKKAIFTFPKKIDRIMFFSDVIIVYPIFVCNKIIYLLGKYDKKEWGKNNIDL